MTPLEVRMTSLEDQFKVLREQNLSTIHMAAESISAHRTAGAFYTYLHNDIKEVKAQQSEHTSILNGHTKQLDELTSVVSGHTKQLDELTSVVNGHTKQLDEILRLVRALN